jgi:hypothetical protein
MQWRAPICLSKRAELDVIPSGIEVDIESKYAYPQKQVLIDALDIWIETLWGKSCGNLNCPEYQ